MEASIWWARYASGRVVASWKDKMPIVTLGEYLGQTAELNENSARLISRSRLVDGIRRHALEQQRSEAVVPSMVAHLRSARTPRARQVALSAEAQTLLRLSWQIEASARAGGALGDASLFARVSAVFLPAQIYYALFNSWRALTIVMDAPIFHHKSLHDDFAGRYARLLPLPWSLTLHGDYRNPSACVLTPPDVITPYAFNPMETYHDAAAYTWATLRTTRKWQFEDARDKWLHKNKKKNGAAYVKLPRGRAESIMSDLRPTTILDFLYQLRIRAYYETGDEFSADAADSDFSRLADGLIFLMHTGLLLSEAQIARRVGIAALPQVAESWVRSMPVSAGWIAQPLRERMHAIQAYS